MFADSLLRISQKMLQGPFTLSNSQLLKASKPLVNACPYLEPWGKDNRPLTFPFCQDMPMIGVSSEEPPALQALPAAPKSDVDTQSLTKDPRAHWVD